MCHEPKKIQVFTVLLWDIFEYTWVSVIDQKQQNFYFLGPVNFDQSFWMKSMCKIVDQVDQNDQKNPSPW